MRPEGCRQFLYQKKPAFDVIVYQYLNIRQIQIGGSAANRRRIANEDRFVNLLEAIFRANNQRTGGNGAAGIPFQGDTGLFGCILSCGK